MAEKENGALSVPQLTAAEEAKTSTSIGLCWTESKGASEYEMLVDGNLYAMGDALSYIHDDLDYHSIACGREMRKGILHGVSSL
jgi:hypothetical protein